MEARNILNFLTNITYVYVILVRKLCMYIILQLLIPAKSWQYVYITTIAFEIKNVFYKKASLSIIVGARSVYFLGHQFMLMFGIPILSYGMASIYAAIILL